MLLSNLLDNIQLLAGDEEQDFHGPDYDIHQFSDTVVGKDYSCFYVQSHIGILDFGGGNSVPEKFVIKASNRWEREIVLELSSRGFSVPAVYFCVKNKNKDIVFLFEEYVDGRQIWQVDDKKKWIEAAGALASIHRSFWGKAPAVSAGPTMKRIQIEARAHCYYDPTLAASYKKAHSRILEMPQTLLHGDCFATNVIVGDSPVFIDWKDSGNGPYVCDIARLTGTINWDTSKTFCPCPDETVKAYYDGIQGVLNKQWDDFLQDIYAGWFIEVAANYIPENNENIMWDKGTIGFSQTHKKRLQELSARIV